MLDISILRNVIDVQTVLDTLNIDYVKKGKRFWILCPFHNDRHVGSAFINENGYFKCFACGEDGDVFTLVQKVKNCTFVQAVFFLGSLFGVLDVEEYDSEKDILLKEYRMYKLSKEETEALQIPQNVQLKNLFFADKTVYKETVLSRAKEMIKKYDYLIQNSFQRNGSDAAKVAALFGQFNKSSIYVDLANEAKRRITICEDVIERFA